MVLDLMQRKPGLSLAEMATALNWTYANGEPNKSRVDRTLHKLQRQKLVKLERDTWKLTKEGEKIAAETPAAKAAATFG